MAIVDKNSILQGVHGKIGDDVELRKVNRQQVLANKSHKKVKKTVLRQAQQDRFKIVEKLAKADLADPVKRAQFEALRKPGQSAYTVAISFHYNKLFLNGKEIPEKPRRRRGKRINGIKTKKITLLVDTSDNTFIETRIPVPDDKMLEWLYAAARLQTADKITNIHLRI